MHDSQRGSSLILLLLFRLRPRTLEEPVCVSERRVPAPPTCEECLHDNPIARPTAGDLRTSSHVLCDNPSLSSYEPYEHFPPLGEAPIASPGRAPQSLPPRAPQWTRAPHQAPFSEGPRPPSGGTRKTQNYPSPNILSHITAAKLNCSWQKQ